MLDGYKTYIIGAALLLWAIGGGIAGKIDWNTAVAEGLVACGMLGLRIGINSNKQ